MVRKKQFDYFGKLEKMAQYSSESATLLLDLILDYSTEKFIDKSEKIHRLEGYGDRISKEIMTELYDAFITPIDREDIVMITNCLDDILDELNATTYLFENLLVYTIRPNTDKFLQLVVTATADVVQATKEFAKFKHSKVLKQYIEQVNKTESEADRLYSSLVQDLFANEKDPIEVIKWRDIYNHLEKITDACEVAADVIEGLVIKNS
ncbi:DUF47 family protein [Enterococcus dongliensis]|uniref:DUF47 family protein n=1 Tax=Enterococcus dongliensis TaxID=2559925 RepID=A0AAP5NBB2_9ENTE|nr:DUF47 family protein [Enterococcus dongliensis]MDT2595944.1 DUF47 family protein [Enterococcus dongliensis]MDT2602795.1 DUF47 family protein [Enterococcus dongliensis]MDT2612255.1 DUF47 family protein [Enterococcus dongliensis]MDT2634011.1 DUF47 family protein [Enterococcus dongliensis]MDT2637227.1 DUF47 family protein [Enterococcus dongliensis]